MIISALRRRGHGKIDGPIDDFFYGFIYFFSISILVMPKGNLLNNLNSEGSPYAPRDVRENQG